MGEGREVVMGSVNGSVESPDGHGRGGGCSGGCEVVGDSGLGASGISSSAGEDAFGAIASSASCISTSAAGGGGLGSLGGVGSFFGAMIVVGSVDVDISIPFGSSAGRDGGAGEDLLDITSLSAGERASVFTDADLIRSRCCLSSIACCNSLCLKDIGRFSTLVLSVEAGVGVALDLSSSVCVEASTYTGFGFGAVRPFVLVEFPEVLRATPLLCSR